jgi:IS5 family transposase
VVQPVGPGVEEALYDSAVMRQFVGIDLGCEPAPDQTTVCKFRHLLEEHHLGEQILGTVNLHLQAQGVRITTGTIVDATILHAPTSTKNHQQQRDPEMHHTKKGKQWCVSRTRAHARDAVLFLGRSPPRLLNAAAPGDLKPAPVSRLREAVSVKRRYP